MKRKSTRLLITLIAGTALTFSCEKHDHDTIPDDPSKEYRFVRIMVSDRASPSLSLISPSDGTVSAFNAKHAASSLYTTESGRYFAVLHRENNLTEVFDTGLESHADHVDVRGTPKFGTLTGESAQPTHFKSKKGELMTFNDGDGTLSVGLESEVHTPGAKMTTINAGLLRHHGAMATFANGTYAITEKDNSIAGTLPEKVKIINRAGTTLHEAKIATQGIHGNATDGTYAVFGSASGILIVESSGNQKLIPHPADFGTAWFGTLLETNQGGKFVGFTAAKGAYLIDAGSGTVSPLFENTDIMQCKISVDGKKLGVLLHSGELKLIDLSTGKIEKQGKIMNPTDKGDTQKPQLEHTRKFAYITSPKSGELWQVRWADLSDIRKIKAGNSPYRLSIAGYESNESH